MVSQERLAHLAQFTDEHLAYHEAGHAVVHHLQGGTIVRLSIARTDPKQGMYPAKQPTPTESADQQKALRDLVALLVAGEVAATIHGAPESVVEAGGAARVIWAGNRASRRGRIYPANCFTTGSIGNVAVACLTAEQQQRFHRGYELRERDRQDLARLNAAFEQP